MRGSRSASIFQVFRSRKSSEKVARFRQINWRSHVHHDALEFPDGQVVDLRGLRGQHATVLQLPASPRATNEASSRSAVLSLPDRAARYRACLAVEAIERAIGCRWLFHYRAATDRIAEGGTLALCVIRSKEPRLSRPALKERDRAHAWFGLRGSDCNESHPVGTLK